MYISENGLLGLQMEVGVEPCIRMDYEMGGKVIIVAGESRLQEKEQSAGCR